MPIGRPLGRSIRVLKDGLADPTAGEAVWIDLVDPTDAQRAAAARLTGLRVPGRADLDEIESSSRLRREDGVLWMSTPLAMVRRDARATSAPIGFVVSRERIVTIRFIDYPSIEHFADNLSQASLPVDPHAVLIGILEAITDRTADTLEHVAGELDALSGRIFAGNTSRKLRQQDRVLRAVLTGVGQSGDVASVIADSLLGLGRMTLFLEETFHALDDASLHKRLDVVGRDLRSLSDFGGQLTNKVQFLLDATLGFINIEQNSGIRVITVASIIGIAPTLIAGIYGMNFKDIPELNWSFGYWYALALMAATIIGPLIWFRRIGWL